MRIKVRDAAGSMTRHRWFRNTEWSETIEEAFADRLGRATKKADYLRIQASYLTKNYPQVALRLLDQYFALGEDAAHAQAHVQRAESYLVLGEVRAAVACYEAALAREGLSPNLLTQAYVDLPVLIATQCLTDLYDRALNILDRSRSRPTFPLEQYRWNAARALILKELGDAGEAKAAAERALVAAAKEMSGFRYQAHLGLVQQLEDDLGSRVRAFAEKPDKTSLRGHLRRLMRKAGSTGSSKG
ncbi:tetratricopeptide repeat protein [Muricoccus nepalensis]|uniref:hypothetical protein n=1 Tax=Muricoccus nepalensis TaxID=1854500 RepID=UPI001883409A|nr:hypothetical protein [Roseomonas nepalensis]